MLAETPRPRKGQGRERAASHSAPVLRTQGEGLSRAYLGVWAEWNVPCSETKSPKRVIPHIIHCPWKLSAPAAGSLGWLPLAAFGRIAALICGSFCVDSTMVLRATRIDLPNKLCAKDLPRAPGCRPRCRYPGSPAGSWVNSFPYLVTGTSLCRAIPLHRSPPVALSP